MASLVLACVIVSLGNLSLEAQPSSTYYNGIDGKTEAALKTALHGIIRNHTNVGYDGLYDVYQQSDVRSDGKVWDMYSGTTHYSFTNKCGSYQQEGDCFNREHSFPQSWFGSGLPKSDAFQVIPTDGYVNNRRGNYPLANVGTTTYTSNGGFSKLGTCSNQGYSGKVFEPNDEYKGDLARMYFYMATRYEDNIASWRSNSSEAAHVLAGNSYPAYQSWYIDVLLQWHRQDPVSQKEIDRNNAIFGFQHNRNPFIDYPILAEFIWGDFMLQDFFVAHTELYKNSYNGETIGGGGSTGTTTYKLYYNANNGVSAPPAQSVEAGGSVTVSSTTPIRANYAFAFWNTKTDGSGTSYNPGDVISLTSNLTLYAIWTYNGTGTGQGTGEWTLATSSADLNESYEYVIACNSKAVTAGELSNPYFGSLSATFSSDLSTITSLDENSTIFTLKATGASWNLLNRNNEMLGATSVKNLAWESGVKTWNISIALTGKASITSTISTYGSIQYNATYPRFNTYTSVLTDIQLYYRSTIPSTTHTITLSAPHNTLQVLADGALLTGVDGVYTTHKSAVIYIAADTEEGYVTESWSMSPSNFDVEISDDCSFLTFTMPDDDVSFSATVRKALEYTVSLIIDGETYADVVLYEYDQMSVAMGQADAPEKEGYEFLGWAYDSEGMLFAESDDVVSEHLLGGAVNLYAIYGKLPIITFIADNDIVSSVIATHHAVIFPAENPMAKGYVFMGWTSDIEVASDGAGIRFAEEGDEVIENTTFRAVFAKQEGEAIVELLNEDFSSLSEGSITNPSSVLWSGNANFTSIIKAYSAGGVLKLGSSSAAGSICSKTLTAKKGSVLHIQFKVKGWTTVESQIKVSVTGCTDQIISYTAKSTDEFETKNISFTLMQDNPIVTFATTANRAFLDDILISTGGGFIYRDYTFHPIVANGILGDANDDGVVDVSDVTLVVSYVLGTLSEGNTFVFEQANVATSAEEGNETIDVSDITAIVAIILGK